MECGIVRAVDASVLPASLRASDLNRVTSTIIAAAIQVHRLLGPGLLESVYHACLRYELARAGLRFESQKGMPVRYKEVTLSCGFHADLVVEQHVIVELKAVDVIAAVHIRQLQTYLRLSGLPVGLLLNFGAPTMRQGIKRVVNGFPEEP